MSRKAVINILVLIFVAVMFVLGLVQEMQGWQMGILGVALGAMLVIVLGSARRPTS